MGKNYNRSKTDNYYATKYCLKIDITCDVDLHLNPYLVFLLLLTNDFLTVEHASLLIIYKSTNSKPVDILMKYKNREKAEKE